MSNRFNFQFENPILEDESVFSETYVPPIIHHRGTIIEQITKTLVKQPTDRVQPIILTGPPGSGKHTITQVIHNTLAPRVQPATPTFERIRIDCRTLGNRPKTTQNILLELLQRITSNTTNYTHSTGRSHAILTEAIASVLTDKFLVLVLDEGKQLPEETLQDIIRHLDSIQGVATTSQNVKRINLIITATEEQTDNHFIDQELNEMTTIVPLPSYDVKQIYNIINERARNGLREHTYDDASLRFIAQTATNAQEAIDVLWRAVKLAEVEEKPNVNPLCVHRSAVERGISVEQRIRNLTYHQQLLLLGIAQAMINAHREQITTSMAREEYNSLCGDRSVTPRRQSRVFDFFIALESEGLITLERTSGQPSSIALQRITPQEIIILNSR